MFHIGREGARACFFFFSFNKKGPLYVEFMEPGMTINADSYYDTLPRLHQVIKKKDRGF